MLRLAVIARLAVALATAALLTAGLQHPTRASRGIKTLDLGKLDGSCARPVALLDIDADTSGDVAGRLRPYDAAVNRALIERSVRGIRGQLPAGAVDMMAAYPSALACKAP